MAQDLKVIIEHVNTFGSPADTTDVLQQIWKMLNAHMDSLQWINQTSGMLQRKVEEVTQVFKHHHCKEQECNVRIALDWMTLSSACCFWIIHYLHILMVFIRVVFAVTIQYLVEKKCACIFFHLDVVLFGTTEFGF